MERNPQGTTSSGAEVEGGVCECSTKHKVQKICKKQKE